MSYMEKPASYEVYKPKILDAISQRFCTLPQIKKYAGIDRSFDVSDVLTWMLDHEEIVKMENANLTAYFLPEKVPVKFWSNGDGRVAVEYAPKTIEKVEKVSGKKFIEVSEADVEFHASKAEGRSLTETQRQVAENLGLGWSNLMKKFKQFPGLKAAFERGRKIYQANHRSEIPSTNGQAKPQKKRKANPAFTKENFYNWGKKGFDSRKIAWELGITFQSVNAFLRWNPEMQEVLESGRNEQWIETVAENGNAEMETEVVAVQTEEDLAAWNSFSDPFPHSNPEEKTQIELCDKIGCGKPLSIPLQHFSCDGKYNYCSDDCMLEDTITDVKKADVSEVKTAPQNFLAKFNPNVHFIPPEPISSEPSETISFGAAGKIELFADLNIFQMDHESRDLLNQFINWVQDFKERNG